MYLVYLDIYGLKLLSDFHLSCANDDGSPRMWTVLVGENGLCKTTILQAIAMAASGYVRANQLADVPSLPDRRKPDEPAAITTRFSFGLLKHAVRDYPGLKVRPESPPLLFSDLRVLPGHSVITGSSIFDQPATPVAPLAEARARNLPHWFVAGYGTSRLLPRPLGSEQSDDPILSRLNPLFDKGRLIGTGFADLLEDPSEFARTLHAALIDSQLLPHATDVEMRGRGSTKSAADLVEKHRFGLKLGGQTLQLPATWLSQGYQSTIAWIADLIGQFFWEAGGPVPLEEMEGLVLIDEIDLHLHPKWQLRLIPTLKRVFPRLQFIVTTHSPMVLPGLKREEVVLLRMDEGGNVVAEQSPEEPALLTGSEIYRTFFGIDRLYPAQLGEDLRRYGFLIANPLRSDEEEQEMRELQQRLAEAGVDPGWEPVPREELPPRETKRDSDTP